MKIPKKYKDKVYSFEKCGNDFNEGVAYEVALNDGYEYCGDGLIYCDSYRDALEVMREAEKVE